MKRESEILPEIPLWVRIKTGHDSLLVDVEQLKSELEEQKIPVQLSYPWHPSASTRLEFIFELFANINIQDILVDGMIYDLTKFLGKKILKSLKSFAEKNKKGDFEPIFIIQFDDITIQLNGYEYKSIKVQTQILKKIGKHLKELTRRGINGIIKIEIPCFPTYLPDDMVTGNQKIWRILYGAEEEAFYIPSARQII